MQHVEHQILLLLNYGGLRNLDSQSGYIRERERGGGEREREGGGGERGRPS